MIKKIIWAADAFPEDKKGFTAVATLLKGLTAHVSVKVEPVYVLMVEDVSLPKAGTKLLWMKDYVKSAGKALANVSKKMGIKNMSAPKVLTTQGGGVREAAQILNEYAKKTKADLIVVSTHGRKGLSRLFLGSFAETLVLSSKLPVLCVNPRSHSKFPSKKVLFPTDLSLQSKKCFEQWIDFNAGEKTEIILFHQIPHPVEPLFSEAMNLFGGYYASPKMFFDEETLRREKVLKAWASSAIKKGISCKVKVVYQGGSISDSVLAMAQKEKTDLIALASESGPMAAALVGSVSRQIIRAAQVPVWIMKI